MTDDTLLLIGRETGCRSTYETHADRLRERELADVVRVLTYGSDPVRDLRDDLTAVETERAYVVPASPAHTHETVDEVPRALSYLDADLRYCEPVGRHPAVTWAVRERAAEHVEPGPDVGLALVGLGNSAGSYSRRMVETHADRLRDEYGAVRACYLLQNPAVECVRYNLPTSQAVVVPVFAAPDAATEQSIPERLNLDRGGLAYANPLGTHPGVTDALEEGVASARAVDRDGPASFEDALASARAPMAADGEGPGR